MENARMLGTEQVVAGETEGGKGQEETAFVFVCGLRGRFLFLHSSGDKMKHASRNHGFTSVGAFCQRVFRVCFGAVVLSMLRLKCLVKRKGALRGRNLSRDSQVEGAPMVHPTSDVHVASEVVFCAPIGHLRDASENPNVGNGKTVEVATSGSPRSVVVGLRFLGGIVSAVLRCRSRTTRRLDSPLRSHRTGQASPRPGVFRAE